MTFSPQSDFDESKIVRDADGKFGEKTGSAPNISLIADLSGKEPTVGEGIYVDEGDGDGWREFSGIVTEIDGTRVRVGEEWTDLANAVHWEVNEHSAQYPIDGPMQSAGLDPAFREVVLTANGYEARKPEFYDNPSIVYTRADVVDYAFGHGAQWTSTEERDALIPEYEAQYLLSRRTDDLPGYNYNRDYYDRLNTASETSDPNELAQIALKEDEDDFYIVVANAKTVTPDTLDYVAKHPSFAVRGAVIDNPATSTDTLRRIAAEASVSADAALNSELNFGPMRSQYEWEETKNRELVGRASAALDKR